MSKRQQALFARYFSAPPAIGQQGWKWNATGDYILIDTRGGIEFYTPNDEDWGEIVAVSRPDKLAHNTGFFEMDDMTSEYVDYHQVVSDGTICCQFEVDK